MLAAARKRVRRHVPRVRCLKYNWSYPPPFGLALSTWWCTLLCARIYVFCARDLVQIEACPVWLWDSLLAAGRPKREAEGVEPTLDRILVVCLFWIWFRCVQFCSEMNQNHWAKFFVSTGTQCGGKGMAEPAGKASGSGLKEDRKTLQKGFKGWTHMHELSLYYIGDMSPSALFPATGSRSWGKDPEAPAERHACVPATGEGGFCCLSSLIKE